MCPWPVELPCLRTRTQSFPEWLKIYCWCKKLVKYVCHPITYQFQPCLPSRKGFLRCISPGPSWQSRNILVVRSSGQMFYFWYWLLSLYMYGGRDARPLYYLNPMSIPGYAIPRAFLQDACRYNVCWLEPCLLAAASQMYMPFPGPSWKSLKCPHTKFIFALVHVLQLEQFWSC